MSEEKKSPDKKPHVIKESGTGSPPPKKKNPFIEKFINKLSKAVDALAKEEEDINAFSKGGIDLKKIDPTAIKNIGKDLKNKLDKKIESKTSETKPEQDKPAEKKSESSDQDKP